MSCLADGSLSSYKLPVALFSTIILISPFWMVRLLPMCPVYALYCVPPKQDQFTKMNRLTLLLETVHQEVLIHPCGAGLLLRRDRLP